MKHLVEFSTSDKKVNYYVDLDLLIAFENVARVHKVIGKVQAQVIW